MTIVQVEIFNGNFILKKIPMDILAIKIYFHRIPFILITFDPFKFCVIPRLLEYLIL